MTNLTTIAPGELTPTLRRIFIENAGLDNPFFTSHEVDTLTQATDKAGHPLFLRNPETGRVDRIMGAALDHHRDGNATWLLKSEPHQVLLLALRELRSNLRDFDRMDLYPAYEAHVREIEAQLETNHMSLIEAVADATSVEDLDARLNRFAE
jgi:hypothetical protein